MTVIPRPPLHGGLSTWPRRALVWCAVVLAVPAIVLVWGLLTGHRDAVESVLLLALVALPGCLLRPWPYVGLPLMIAATALAAATVSSVAVFAGTPVVRVSWDIVFAYTFIGQAAVAYVAALHRPRLSLPSGLFALLGQLAVTEYVLRPDSRSSTPDQWLLYAVLGAVTAWIIGNSIRARRRYAAALRDQAVTAERLRIARELHDMISHSIGVIAIQAGMGARVLSAKPDAAREALRTIETTSRETLAELRRTLGSLRRAQAVPADFSPAPGLADLDRLAAATADAGVRVAIAVRGTRPEVPADVDLSAYRIVQEALTNVVRHADTRTCRVEVTYGPAELSVEVTDDGRGGKVDGTGFGLVGMRERAAMLGGEFSAGPRPGGGFAVAARLPILAGAKAGPR